MALLRRRKKKTLIRGNAERLRLSVFRSNTNIFAQLIDDQTGQTLVAVSSLKMKLPKSEAARLVGKELAQITKDKKINTKVVFDRGNYVYTGRVKALAEGAREAGLEF